MNLVLDVSSALRAEHAKHPLSDFGRSAEQAAAEMLVEELTKRFHNMKFTCDMEAENLIVDSDPYNGGCAVTFAEGFIRGIVATWPRPYVGRGNLAAPRM